MATYQFWHLSNDIYITNPLNWVNHINHINHTISLTWNLRPFGDDFISLTNHDFQGSLTTWGHYNLPSYCPIISIIFPWYCHLCWLNHHFSYGFLWFPMVSHENILVFLQFSFTTCTAVPKTSHLFSFLCLFGLTQQESNGNPMDIQWENMENWSPSSAPGNLWKH